MNETEREKKNSYSVVIAILKRCLISGKVL